MSTISRHLGRGESGLPRHSIQRMRRRDTTFKDQLLLRTYPGTERSSLPTAGMHDHIQIFPIRARKLSSSDPGSSGYVSSSRCLGTRKRCACRLVAVHHSNSSETCLWTKQLASAIDRKLLVEPDGIE